MLYNKSKNRKVEDKKVLHKIRKKWVVVSSALLMALGGYAAVTHTSAVHADVNGANATNRTISSSQGTGSTSQLTNDAGKSLTPQKQTSQTSAVNNNITDQARQLHSQIIQNSVKQSTGSATDQNVHNGESASADQNTVARASNNSANVSYSKPQSRKLGDSDSNLGTITVEDVDIYDGDQDVSSGIGSSSEPNGTPFTKSDQESYMKLAPRGYIYNNIISAPTKYIAGQNQMFKIAVVPRKTNDSASSRILLEYTNASDGDMIVGKTHQFSDVPGTHFNLVQWEANRPDGFVLDPEDKNSNTISYQSSDKGTPTDIRSFVPSNSLMAPQPVIKFLPGSQLIQIGVKRSNNVPKPVNNTANMTIDYVDTSSYSTVSSKNVSGKTGSPFDISPYTQSSSVPNGYDNPRSLSSNPTTYVNGDTATILVTPVSNKPAKQSDQMTVKYVGSNGGQIGGVYNVSGQDGTAFDVSKYESAPYLPTGYQVANVVNGVNTFEPDHVITINVSKKAQKTMAVMPVVYYVDNNGSYQTVGNTLEAKGNTGADFDVTPYITSDVPVNYNWVGYRSNVPATYQNGQSVAILVAPKANNNDNNHSKQTQMVNIPVQYMSGNTIVDYISNDTKPANTAFNANAFMTLPSGISSKYKFNGFVAPMPTSYDPARSQVLKVSVSPINNSNPNNNHQHNIQPTSVDIPIQYWNGNTLVSDVNESQPSGNMFNPDTFKTLPSDISNKYQFAGFSAPIPMTYDSNQNQTLRVNVTPINNQPNNKSNNQPQMVNIPVQYWNGNQLISDVVNSEPAGSAFNVDKFKTLPSDIASSYRFNGFRLPIPSTYTPGQNQVLNINVTPILKPSDKHSNNNSHNTQPKTVDIPVQYWNGNQLVSDVNESQPSGSVFNPATFKTLPNDISSKYQFAGFSAPIPMTYDPNQNQTLKVNITPIDNTNHSHNNVAPKQQITMPVEYQYKGQTIPNGNEFSTGSIGSKFDITPFENNVPGNYEFAGTTGLSEPQSYEPGDAVIINVKPETPSDVTMNVNYVYNNQTVATATAKGPSGQSFNIAQYEQHVPNGAYHFDPQNDSVDSPNVYMSGYPITIHVSPNAKPSPTPQPKMANMHINYIYNNVVVGTGTASGIAGQSLNPQQYEQAGQLPSGFKYNGGKVYAPNTYTNGQSITIAVSPIGNSHVTPNRTVHMDVNYMYKGSIVGSGTASGTAGQPINFSQYEQAGQVPSGFKYNGGTVYAPNTYTNGQSITIGVKPINSDSHVTPNRTVHMDVNYMYKGSIVGNGTASGTAGQPINVSQYEQAGQVPSGFKYNGGTIYSPKDYLNGQSITINVVPVNNGQNVNPIHTVNMPINYMYGNQIVGTGTASGTAGQPLNVQTYEQTGRVPNGFKYANGKVYAPKNYANNQSMTIQVVPIVTNNNNRKANGGHQQPQANSFITVDWVNGETGQISDNLTIPGQPGHAFDLAYYLNSAPDGTHSTGQTIGYPVTTFTTHNQTVRIKVMPNSEPVQQYGTITIQCIDPSGKNVGVSDTSSHKAGTPFNLSSEMQFVHVPSNYHIVRLLNSNINQYQPGQHNIYVEVAPNQSTSTSSSATSANVNPSPQPQSQSSNPANTGNVTPQPTDNNNTANPSFNPVFNPVINNTVPQSSNSAADPANNRTNSYAPSSTETQSIANSSIDPVNSNEAPASNVEHHNTQGASTEPTNDPQTAGNQSIGSRFGHRGAAGTSQVRNGSDPEPTSDPESTNDPQPTSDPEGTGYTGQQGQLGYAHTAGASEVRNGSFNGAESDDVTGGNVVSGGNGQAVSNNNGSQLPQTGENDHSKDMAAVLLALGSSLSALGYAIDRRRRYHTDPRAGRFNK